VIHLDSSFLIDLLREQRRQPGRASAWIAEHAGEPLAVSLFVACELEAGAAAAAHPESERVRVRDALKAIAIVFPDDRFAAAYGALCSTMQRRGHTIGTMDLLIATNAIVEGVPLLTGNRRHFEAVPDLTVLSYR
jgi:tRNA(fMet)-specific endonuclease VapC